ncbi:MAG: DUF350 domain-containing protein [Hafnia sp.]
MSFFESVATSLNMAISLSSLVTFAVYIAVAATLMALHIKVYTIITPHNEFALIRSGNPSASIALAGAIIGFAIPMANVISHSISLIDFIVWAVVASCVQLIVFFIASKVVKGLSDKIIDNDHGAAIFVASLAIAIGLLNAACMTPDESAANQVVEVQAAQVAQQ